MLRKLWAPVVALVLSAQAALAGDDPVVVELYTSQGCSSCPPADALMHELAAREDVIALALHVDYWDYIGWKDIFADPDHATRQRKYAKNWGQRMVYTPQMVVAGRSGIVGNKPKDVDALIARNAAREDRAELTVSRKGGKLHIEAMARQGLTGPLDIQVAWFDPLRTVDITRGENAGRRLSYANVVTDLRDVGDWVPGTRLDLNVAAPGDGPVAVFLQQKGMGPIEAAAVLR